MKMKRIIRIAVFGLLLALANSASAANFTARISNVLIYEQGELVYIYVEGGTKDRPACAGTNGDYISFSMKRPHAKEYMSGLLFAFGSRKPVTFWTNGACVDQSVSDTLTYFMISNG